MHIGVYIIACCVLWKKTMLNDEAQMKALDASIHHVTNYSLCANTLSYTHVC
jgi:hypothetical protein